MRATLIVPGLTLALLGAAKEAPAQDAANDVALEISRIAREIRTIRQTPSLTQRDRIFSELSFAERRARFFLLYAALRQQWGVAVTPAEVAAAREPDTAAVEQARTDVQPGATASSSGTSSLVSKGSGPSFFAAAVETGALVRATSATTTTFQGNAVGIFDALGSKGYFSGYQDDSAFARFMRRVSFSFTVRNTDPAATPLPEDAGASVTEAVRQRLDEVNARLEQYTVRAIVGRNRRDPRDVSNVSALRALMDTKGQALLDALDEALSALQTSDEYEAWRAAAVRDVMTVAPAMLEGALVRQLNLLNDLAAKLDPGFFQQAVSAQLAYQAFASARSSVLEQIEKRPVFALEFVDTRREPRFATMRFIGEVQKGRWDLTANAAVTAYHRKPAADGPWYRDIQVAVEAARPLGSRFARGQPANRLGNAVLAFAFLYERLSESASVRFANRDLLAPEGNLYIAQLRLTLPMGASGTKIPLSISAANRNELLEEKEVRANIGFTFNFDAVASLLKR
jgi:hypothetical protein